MLKIFTKKRITEDRLANIFVNSLFEMVEKSFPDIAEEISDHPEFLERPAIARDDSGKFLMIVLAGNLKFLPEYFRNYRDVRLTDMITAKFSHILDTPKDELQKLIGEYQNFLIRVNHPSKNTLYAMSKAMFHKYNLNNSQKEYYKKINQPNPIFLKRMDEIFVNFIWNWKLYKEKYLIVE